MFDEIDIMDKLMFMCVDERAKLISDKTPESKEQRWNLSMEGERGKGVGKRKDKRKCKGEGTERGYREKLEVSRMKRKKRKGYEEQGRE